VSREDVRRTLALNTLIGAGLLLASIVTLAWAVRFLIGTSGPSIAAPEEFLEILSRARIYAWGIATFAAGLLCSALTIVWKPRLGWTSLSVLLSVAAVTFAVVRVMVVPRYVFEADWFDTFGLAVLVSFAWHNLLRRKSTPNQPLHPTSGGES
jgi:hypothetical protein